MAVATASASQPALQRRALPQEQAASPAQTPTSAPATTSPQSAPPLGTIAPITAQPATDDPAPTGHEAHTSAVTDGTDPGNGSDRDNRTPLTLPPAGGGAADLPQGGSTLPDGVVTALRAAAVPLSATGFVVLPLSGEGGLSLALNAGNPLNPASTMKLVTTYAALNLLGPGFVWQTEALSVGPQVGDVLQGTLVLRGGGDPGLVVEHLWLLVQRIRQQGIRDIAGDLLLDTSAFEAGSYETGTLDGNELRPYNVAPYPLLINYKAITLSFIPDPEVRKARLVTLPALSGVRTPSQVRAVDGPCGDWRGRLQVDFSDPLAPQFRGAYPLSCGERTWNLSVLAHQDFVAATFRTLWESSGGVWRGKVREGIAPAGARRLAIHESAPLAMVIREINKYSNNVMTRQLFLTIGAETSHQPGNPERAQRAVRDWLASRGLTMPELVMENGAGLSRVERISAASLARLLSHAWKSAVMPELMASLPVPGVDGTMKNRNVASGSAHVKTGMLNEVRAAAGYVLAASGRRYVVVGLINHPSAGAALPAIDALLQWVYLRG